MGAVETLSPSTVRPQPPPAAGPSETQQARVDRRVVAGHVEGIELLFAQHVPRRAERRIVTGLLGMAARVERMPVVGVDVRHGDPFSSTDQALVDRAFPSESGR